VLKNIKSKSYKIDGTTEGEIEDSLVLDRVKFLFGWMRKVRFNLIQCSNL